MGEGHSTESGGAARTGKTPMICVLSVGRSGTSVVMRALDLLGVDIGPQASLAGPNPEDNARGYFEQWPIINLNEEVLAALGGGWYRPPPLPPGWERDARLEPLRERALETVSELFPADRVCAWKDPRTALTLPFWRPAFDRPLRFVICVRTPNDVAASLEARDAGLHPWEESTRVWLRDTALALDQTATEPRIVSFYDDWFDDTDRQVDRLAEFAGVDATQEARAAVRRFVDPGLRHHATSADAAIADDRVDPRVRALFALLVSAREGDVLPPLAGSLPGALRRSVESDVAARADQVELSAERDRLEARLDEVSRYALELRAELDACSSELERVYGGRWWRLGRALRTPVRRAQGSGRRG